MSLHNPQSVRHAAPEAPPIFNFAPTETQYDRGFFGQAQNNTRLQENTLHTNVQMPGSDSASLPGVSPMQQQERPGQPEHDGSEMVFNYFPKADLANNFQQLQQNASNDSLPKPDDSWANQAPPAAPPQNELQNSEVRAKQHSRKAAMPNVI